MNQLAKLLLLVAFLLAATLPTQAQFRRPRPGPQPITVLSGGTVIDMTGAPPMADAMVVIEGNLIKGVGKKGSISYPSDAKVVDTTGKYIMPSFIDAHIHYREWLPELMLYYGVTAHSDMGNPTDWILAQRDAIAEGKIIGPRIFASGDQLGIRAPAGNLQEALQTVRSHISKGVNKIALTMLQDPEMIKAIVAETEKADIPISAWTMYPYEAVQLGVSALEHSYTLGIASKYHDSERLKRIREEQEKGNLVSRYEKKSMEYLMTSEPDDFIQLLVQKKAFLIPDLAFDFKIINDRAKEFEAENVAIATNPLLRYIPVADWLPQLMSYSEAGITHNPTGIFGTLDRQSPEFGEWVKGYRTQQRFLRKLVQAGGKVLAGSDAPNILLPGVSLHHELQLLVDAGLTTQQALMTATIWPAEFLREQSKLGTLQAGKMADLIVLRANPLEDIKNTKSIEMVMKDGEFADRTFHPNFQNPIPRPIVSESQGNPLPVISNLSPKMATEGDREAVISISGTGFIKASMVAFDGVWVPTTFISDWELKAVVPARLLERPGTYPITVWSPRPFGGTSGAQKFIVQFR